MKSNRIAKRFGNTLILKKLSNVIKALFVAIIFALTTSCAESPKYKTEAELGKEVFRLFRNGKTDQLRDLVITKEELRKVFSTHEKYKTLKPGEQNELVSSTYEDTKKYTNLFIKVYTDKTEKETKALQNGVFENVLSEPVIDFGPPSTSISVLFSSGEQKYILRLNAARVNDYWKLLSWIEVRQRW